MAFNFLERLGTMLGRRAAERVLERRSESDEPAPTGADAQAADASAEAPPVEAPVAEAAAEAPTAEAAPIPETTSEDTVPSGTTDAAVDAPAPDVTATVSEPVSPAPPSPVAADTVTTPEPAPMAAEAAPATEAAPTEPVKSAEELEEERLWAETDAAWATGDFQKVTELLDALKGLQPEDAAEIDEKIAAAQFNQAAAFEESGDLDRALYLYQDAQRRNPNLGEASFAIERIQAQVQPPAPAAEPAPETPAEQSYTVEAGDSLWAIAERHYGDGSQWARIFEANRDQLDNPDVIQPGQVLRVPV